MIEGMAGTAALIPQWTAGDRVTKAREVAGFSVQALADQLGVHRNTLSNWENDRIEVPRTALIAISALTEVDLWWLAGEEPTDGRVTEGYPLDACVTELLAA